MPDDSIVPEGWMTTTLGALGRYLNGRAFKSSEWTTTGRPIIRIQDLTGSNRNPNYFEGEVEDRYVIRHGDLLISWSATLGAYIWDGPEAVLNQHIFKVESKIDKKFHYHLVRKCIGELERQAHGSGMVHVTKGIFESTPVAIPADKRAQAAIARLIDLAESKQTSAARHVVGAQLAIERFRQAILAAACSGRLTADWRNGHDDDVQQLVEDLRLASAERRKPVAEPDPQLVEDLPSGWEPVALDLLIDRIEAGKSVRAEGRPANEDEWGVVKVSAMSWGRFLEGENKAISDDRLINPAYEIHRSDLLISRANTVDLVGATVLVNDTRPRLLLSDKSLRLVPRAGIDRAWLNYMLRSQLVTSQFSERATGTSDSMRNLSQAKILSTTMPLPTIEEQLEIARRVDQLLELADGLERRIDSAARKVERSSQAILAKAFRGELPIGAES